MDTSNNSRPLLQQSNSDSEYIDDDSEDVHTGSMTAKTVAIASAGHRKYLENVPGTSTTTDDETELLFKSPTATQHDRFSFNYIVFYLMGIITLLPWNFFITAEDVSDMFSEQLNCSYSNFIQLIMITLCTLKSTIDHFCLHAIYHQSVLRVRTNVET